MSKIKSLCVSGIRSFGADDNDRQVIEFERPLTLILGENGCGKTTIIECLQHALCGEFPPQCEKGKNFVHHPKMNKTREVLGQIRLKFSDCNGTRYLVVRSMQLQIKGKQLGFSKLDTTIQTISSSGQTVDISGRVVDANATLASILGVSKAILANVIFCHQEDSEWPLGTGKSVKERFDAIFDVTKYNDCFENIRKMRKDYTIKIGHLEKDVSHLKEKIEEIDSKKKKIFNDEERLGKLGEQLAQLEAEIAPQQLRLRQITRIKEDIFQHKTRRETANDRMENHIQQQVDLKKSIKNIFNGTDNDLECKIASFEMDLRDKEKQLKNAERELKCLEGKEDGVGKQLRALEISKSQHFLLEAQNHDKMSSRNDYVEKAYQFAGVQNSGDLENEAELKTALQQLEDTSKTYKQEITDAKEKASHEEKLLQKQVDKCRDEAAQHKQKIANKKQECWDLNNQLHKLKEQISEANESKEKLDSIKAKLQQAERHLSQVSEECNVQKLQDAITADDKTVTLHEQKTEELNNIVDLLQSQKSKTLEVNKLKETLAEHQKSVNRLKNKNKEAMGELVCGGKLPDCNYRQTFHSIQGQLEGEVQQLSRDLKHKQHAITALEANRVHQKKDFDSKKLQLEAGKEKIYKLCQRQSLQEVLAKLEADIEKLQDEKSEKSSSEYVIKRFTSKLEEESPCCPICHRGFDSQTEVSDLIFELKDKIRNVPKELEALIDRLSRKMSERDQLILLQPLDVTLQALEETDLPQLEKALQQTEKELQECRDEVDDLSMSLSEPEGKLATCSSMLLDMAQLDQLTHYITKISAEISALESQQGATEGSMTLEEAVQKQREVRQETNRLRALIRSSQEKLNLHNKRLQQARDTRNLLTEEGLKAQAKIQELCSLQTQCDQITEIKERAELEVVSLEGNSNVLKQELEDSEKHKKLGVQKMRLEIDKLQKRDHEFEKLMSTILSLNEEIAEHAKKNIEGKLKEIKVALTEQEINMQGICSSKKMEAERVDKLKHDIHNHEINKRELDDNMKLRKTMQEEKKLREEIKKIDEEMGELNYDVLTQEEQSLSYSLKKAILEKAKTEGSAEELKATVEAGKRELRQKQYQSAEQQYRESFYQLQLLRTADKDIKEYALAMNHCLMIFHNKKMESINAIIREMWQTIYRGNDIDYIEIKTDELKSPSENKRITYDYRVVQHRNDTEIDLRGRCSAGQKVLACLIIRMALAETFSNRFGVLALDEPTTNLDRENVSSLCQALGDMVLSRMKQTNFMFIIITHDAEFLTSLGRIDKLTQYYRVTRNQEGKSRIRKEAI